MSASKIVAVTICLSLALTRAAWAQPAPQKVEVPPATLDERVTGQITPGTGLTADEAARRARAASLQIEAQRQEKAAASAQVDQAKAGYIPRVQVTARYTRLSDIEQGSVQGFTFPVLLNQTVLQGTLTIPISDDFLRVPQSVEAARNAERAAELNTSSAAQQVDNAARQAYYAWVRARLSVTVSEQAVEQARGHLSDVRKAFEVGSASKADVLRVESSLAQAELGVVRARNLSDLAEAQLRTNMRDTSGAPLAIGEDVLADLPGDEGNLAGLTESAASRRPEVKAIDANIAALRSQAKVTRASYLPRLDLFADAYYNNPNQRVFPQEDKFKATWDVGAQLTWTPTDIPATRGAIRESEARAASLAAQREALLDSIRLEVLSALQQVSLARASIATTVQTLSTAAEAYRVRRALFQNGRATSLELTDAELDLTRARLDAINARVDLRVARAQLARATGEAP